MGRSTEADPESAAVRERVRERVDTTVTTVPCPRERTVRLGAGFVALVGLGSLTVLRIVLNAPVDLPSTASGAWFDAAAVAAVVGPAAGAITLGVAADEAWTRTGLILAGVFGLLSVVTPAVALPAVGAIVVGGWLLLAGRTHLLSAGQRTRTAVVTAALLAGLTLSLFGAVGVRPAALRPAGTTVTLVGMAVTPLAFGARPRALGVGGLAAGLTFHLTGTAPFVTGAVTLVAGSAVGASALLIAIAVGGLTASVATGVAQQRGDPTLAGFLLLSAGVPSSIPRALGVVLAVAVVVAMISERSGDST